MSTTGASFKTGKGPLTGKANPDWLRFFRLEPAEQHLTSVLHQDSA